MAVYENVLHALGVEPPSARPGDLIRLRFDAPNVCGNATGHGTVTFLLGDLLEPLSDPVVAVPPAEPGSAVVAELSARVAAGAGDGPPLTVQAVLCVDGASYGSNLAQVTVRTHAILDGARSGTFVEERDDGIVAVRAVVVNEGDGAAHGVRLLLPAPSGCTRLDGDGVAEIACARLEPGAHLEVAFDARVIAPVGTIAANDAEVRCHDGTQRAVAARGTITTRAALAIPEVTVRAGRRRTTIAVALRNDGWADARDVAIVVVLPPAMRPLHDGVSVDGVAVAARTPRRAQGAPLATLAFEGSRIALALDGIAARATAQIEIVAAHAAACDGGVVRIESGAGVVESAFVPQVDRTVRLRVEPGTPPAAPGERIVVAATVANAGDVAERLTLAIAGAEQGCDPLTVAVSPGRIARVVFEATLGERDDDVVADLALVACDDGGERARVAFPVAVRTRARLERSVPGALSALPAEAAPAAPQLRLEAPDAVAAGCAFTVALRIDAAAAIETLTIRAQTPPGARAVAGSTAIDGLAIRENGRATPLEHGVVLRDVPPQRCIGLQWSLIADGSGANVRVGVAVVADGVTVTAEGAPIPVQSSPPFATRDHRLGYHLAHHTVATPTADEPVEAAPARSEPAHLPDTVRLTFAHDGDAPSVAARLLRGDAPVGLAGYLPILGALFPTGSSAAGSAAALAAAGTAIGEGFDRLHVLLRLPGFAPSGEDLEDALQRRALVALYQALFEGPDDGAFRDDAFAVEVERSRLREIVSAFADARFGAPSAIRAILALIPTRYDDEPLLSAALARYIAALDDALRRCERLTGEGADRVLAAGRDAALDDARASLAAALRAHALPMAVR